MNHHRVITVQVLPKESSRIAGWLSMAPVRLHPCFQFICFFLVHLTGVRHSLHDRRRLRHMCCDYQLLQIATITNEMVLTTTTAQGFQLLIQPVLTVTHAPDALALVLGANGKSDYGCRASIGAAFWLVI